MLKPDPYDPKGAKKLLAEAGYPNGFTTSIIDLGQGGVLSTANRAIAGYWRKAGINANLEPLEFNAARSRYVPKQVPEVWNTVYSYGSGGGVFQSEKMVTPYHSTKGTPKNIKNARLDELIDKVPLTADPAEKKKKLALEAAVLAKNEYTTLAILDLRTVFAYGAKIGGFAPSKGLTGITNALETITHAK